MPRLMSVALTEPQVRARTKTQTRRLGWWTTKAGHRMVTAGDQLWLCRKVMGRRPGEPVEKIALVDVVEVRRERLDAITVADVAAEGFPGHGPEWFVEFFCQHMGVTPATEVTVITFAYPEEGTR